jgi:hypothetical protein
VEVNFLKYKIKECNFVEVNAIMIMYTWKNNDIEEEGIYKRLDIFFF